MLSAHIHIYNCIQYIYIYLYVCIYVSYSWSNRWTELAEFFEEIHGYLGSIAGTLLYSATS